MEAQRLSPTHYRLAEAHLETIDPDWERLVKLVGPCTLQAHPAREPYEGLVRAVAYQQIHTRAGDAILARLLALYPQTSFPAPRELLETDPAVLRACGFSWRKIETIRGIAEGALSGLVPARHEAWEMRDEDLIARLVSLRGIGRWTVEMLLIYGLERTDILPADDFGVREGYRVLKNLEAAPSAREMARIGQLLSPYRTVASWYLWRIPRS